MSEEMFQFVWGNEAVIFPQILFKGDAMIVQWLGKVECKSLTGFLNLLPGHNRVWRSFLSWNATSLITRMKNIHGVDWFVASPFLIIILSHVSFLVLPLCVLLWLFVDYFCLLLDFLKTSLHQWIIFLGNSGQNSIWSTLS